ncbi:UPF0481 protein At3g47200-like [Humulus lupulus]|uniref:UPF0481 protein At3g47200-like n=1 Tax=Humulus lupulus TaxID=3486 RepID=UPI002B41784E|nr:UPF0481 protein At3g47200-like [Humulus lupulus]
MSENEVMVSVEELTQRKTIKNIPAGQSHEAADQSSVMAISETRKKVTTFVNNNGIDVCLKLDEIEEKSRTEVVPDDQKPKPKPKIQKVPVADLQGHGEINFMNKYFQPKVVSIGPIHHGNPKLEQGEKYKTELTAEFARSSKKSIHHFFDIIKQNITSLKALFDEELLKDYDDDTLSLMLVVDGCFILQFIISYCKNELTERFNIKVDHLLLALNDLFLLENQIPFEVLTLLMNSAAADPDDGGRLMESMKILLVEFVINNVIMAPTECKNEIQKNNRIMKLIGMQPEAPDQDNNNKQEYLTHLLELLQIVAVTNDDEQDKTTAAAHAIIRSRVEQDLATQVQEGHQMVKQVQEYPAKSQSVRNIQELKAVGIGLKRSNKRWSLKEIKYTDLYIMGGLLQLPRLVVDHFTGHKFMNLIAYEMCPDNLRTDYGVTSYVCFMRSLIDHPNDVKELRSKKILVSLLGCDEQVTKLFDEIVSSTSTELVPNPNMYKDVKDGIRRQYDRKCMMASIADAYDAHFSSPWSAMAFVAAVFALAVKIWCTVIKAE